MALLETKQCTCTYTYSHTYIHAHTHTHTEIYIGSSMAIFTAFFFLLICISDYYLKMCYIHEEYTYTLIFKCSTNEKWSNPNIHEIIRVWPHKLSAQYAGWIPIPL